VTRLGLAAGRVGALLVLCVGGAACSGGPPSAAPESTPSSTTPAPTPAPTGIPALSTARWSPGPPLPVGVSEVGVALVGRQIHVVGGYVAGTPHSTTHLVYDVDTQTWRTGAPLPVALDHVGTATIGATL
jgi:hypothetical protein